MTGTASCKSTAAGCVPVTSHGESHGNSFHPFSHFEHNSDLAAAVTAFGVGFRRASPVSQGSVASSELSADKREPDAAIPGVEPALPRLSISDATVERLAVILSSQPRGTPLARDELAGWLHRITRNSGAALTVRSGCKPMAGAATQPNGWGVIRSRLTGCQSASPDSNQREDDRNVITRSTRQFLEA